MWNKYGFLNQNGGNIPFLGYLSLNWLKCHLKCANPKRAKFTKGSKYTIDMVPPRKRAKYAIFINLL